MKHIGMDVHRATTDMVVLNGRGQESLRRRVETREEALVEALQFRDRRLEVLSIHRRCPRDGHHGGDVLGGRCPPPTITAMIP